MCFLNCVENGDRIAGFLFEPIQGEAGVCLCSSNLNQIINVSYSLIFQLS